MIIYILTFLPLLISCNMIECAPPKTMVNALKCCLAVFMFFCIISIYYYLKNPGLARDMASHQVEGKLAIGGGYSLAYAMAIIGVYIFSKLVNKRIKKSFSAFTVVVICLILVFLTESMITLISMIAGLIISIFTINNENEKLTSKVFFRLLFIVLIISIVAFWVVSNKYEIEEWILKRTSTTDEIKSDKCRIG